MESVWETIKKEPVHRRPYGSREEEIREIAEYIGSFYNRQCRQARLRFLLPAVYTQRFYPGSLPASKVWRPLLLCDLTCPLKMLVTELQTEKAGAKN